MPDCLPASLQVLTAHGAVDDLTSTCRGLSLITHEPRRHACDVGQVLGLVIATDTASSCQANHDRVVRWVGDLDGSAEAFERANCFGIKHFSGPRRPPLHHGQA